MPISNAYIYRLNTKIRSTMLSLSGFELYSRWVPLVCVLFLLKLRCMAKNQEHPLKLLTLIDTVL